VSAGVAAMRGGPPTARSLGGGRRPPRAVVARLVRCAGAAVLVVLAVFVSGLEEADASAAASTPSLVLMSQSATVLPAAPGQPALFQVTVKVTGAPAGTELGLAVGYKLHSRSEFEQTLDNRPTRFMQEVAPAPLSSLRVVGTGLQTGLQLDTTVVEGEAEPDGATTIGLQQCVVGEGTCSGVYPVEVELLDQSGTALAHLTTYLVYAETRSARPLVFSWVVPVAAPVVIRTKAPLAGTIPPLTQGRVGDLEFLTEDLAANPGVQATVAPSPATVQRLEAAGSSAAINVLADLRALAVAGQGRLIAQPYVPVNLASLSEAGVGTEIAGQTQPAGAIMDRATGTLPPLDRPSFSTWVADGPVTAAIASGLAQVGSSSLVVDDTNLPSATELDHASWTQPFYLQLGRRNVLAAAIDSQLSKMFTAEPGDPALAANQLLAELAMIQSELPGANDTRGVIAMPPASWDPEPRFVSALVSGLVDNPVVTTATLEGFFKEVPVGGNSAETTRHLASGADPERISSVEAADIAHARTQLDAFSASVPGTPPVKSQLGDLLLTAESSELTPSAQLADLASFERHLEGELSAIKVVSSTVTLTAQTASIPITITSTADFQMNAMLTLSSGKLVFPQGATRTVHVDHPTNSVEVEVRARTSGDLPLDFVLRSPDGGLTIERGSLTVRSTATSLVGIVLTLAAAVVLLGWWARTWVRGRRRRRPAQAG
jgi:hypothetical protein